LIALVVSSESAMAQANPVITSVVFAAGAPQTVVANSNTSSARINVGCTNVTAGGPSATCSGVAINIMGPMNPPSVAYVINNGSKSIMYTNPAPGANCQTLTVNIRVAGQVVHSTCWVSGKFTATVAKVTACRRRWLSELPSYRCHADH
jgi:hypothetical protein